MTGPYTTRRGIEQAPTGRGRTRDAASGLDGLARHVTRGIRDEMRREQLRAMGSNIPDEGSLAAAAKLTDIDGSD